MPTPPDRIDAQSITDAQRRIAGHVRHTPPLRLSGAALGVARAPVRLELERLPRGAIFKARGIFKRMPAQPIPAAGSAA